MNHEDFPCGSVGKETTCNVGDLGLIPGLGRSLGEGKGCPLQYSDLENSMDCIVHGVAKSWTRLSNIHFISLHESWGFLVAFSGESFPFNLLCSAPPEESLSMAAIALCINISFFLTVPYGLQALSSLTRGQIQALKPPSLNRWRAREFLEIYFLKAKTWKSRLLLDP